MDAPEPAAVRLAGGGPAPPAVPPAQDAPWMMTYTARRAALLERVVATLRADDRFGAAWLIGSFGRGAEDECSDLDLVAIVVQKHAGALCASPWRVAGRTTPQRMTLLQRWGTPAIVHEAHANAPAGGSHTNVLFAEGTRLDLNLVPSGSARRPHDARLLFDHIGVPAEAPPALEAPEQRRETAAQRVALFWIMAVGTATYRRRGWDVAVQAMLTALRGQVETVRRLVAGDAPRFCRYGPVVPLAATPAAQADALRALCDEMAALMPEVVRLGATVPPAPRVQVERWLDAT